MGKIGQIPWQKQLGEKHPKVIKYKECMSELKKQTKGKEIKKRAERKTVKCYSCGKPITRTISKLSKAKKHFCDTKCYYKERAMWYIGEKNGMFGKTHTEEAKKKIISNRESIEYSITKGGIRKDLNKYFRSSWEANYARYLNYKNIKWEYESKTFFFNGYKRGPIAYIVDFYLPELDKYVEIKGRHSSKDRTKLKRLKKEYPEEFSKLIWVLNSSKSKEIEKIKKIGITKFEYYNDIKKDFNKLIETWEGIEEEKIKSKINYEKRKIFKIKEYILQVMEELTEIENYFCTEIEPINYLPFFHIVGIKNEKNVLKVKFIQVKTNSKPKLDPFIEFKEKFPGAECEIWIMWERGKRKNKIGWEKIIL